MVKNLVTNIKLSFFTRLSNFIIIQIVFVFAAFALLFIFPAKEQIKNSDHLILQEKFSLFSEKILATNSFNPDLFDSDKCTNLFQSNFKSIFPFSDDVQSYLFLPDGKGNAFELFHYKSETAEKSNFDNHEDVNNIINRNLIAVQLSQTDEELTQIIPNTKNVVYHYRFKNENNIPVVLVTVIEHNYLVASKDNVLYSFLLLFLGGILVSLLTVYLLNKRFQEPLNHLIYGMEKTANGELCHIIEANKDVELNKLANAFNSMSKTLWHNEHNLKVNNENLEQTNQELINSKEFLRKIIDSSTSSIITTTPEGVIQVFNKTAAKEFDRSIIKAVGTNINELFASSFDWKKLDYNTKDGVEVLCEKGDKTQFPAYLIIAPIYNADKNISSFLYIIRDITESKSFQDMMIRLDRYYTKGEMVGDIAHEINNFLAILSGNIELMPLLLKKNDPEKIDKKFALMRSTVDRIVNFTDGLLESDDEQLNFAQVDINQLIQTVLAFLKPQNKFDFVDIEVDLSTDLPLVEVDIGQIQQLFVNIVYNSGEALLTVEGEKKIVITSEMKEIDGKQNIVITVKDNGPGVAINKEDLIFKKRFTTKQNGHGTGLITSKKILDHHNGSISYKYQEGAVFRIEIPTKHTKTTVSEESADLVGNI